MTNKWKLVLVWADGRTQTLDCDNPASLAVMLSWWLTQNPLIIGGSFHMQQIP